VTARVAGTFRTAPDAERARRSVAEVGRPGTTSRRVGRTLTLTVRARSVAEARDVLDQLLAASRGAELRE
jgi:hypothetical protein